jgi:hypothetical protein
MSVCGPVWVTHLIFTNLKSNSCMIDYLECVPESEIVLEIAWRFIGKVFVN